MVVDEHIHHIGWLQSIRHLHKDEPCKQLFVTGGAGSD